MGCFTSKPPTTEPTAVRGCTDVCWLCLYVAFWILMIVIAIFSFVYGNPVRIINGYDSFGNTCGVQNNEKFHDLPMSGMNTIDKKYVLFLDIKHLRQTLKLCVKECPSQTISTKSELYDLYKSSQNMLCRYDFNMERLRDQDNPNVNYFDYLGPCPTLPVYGGKSMLNRCVPHIKAVPTDVKKDVLNIFDLLNTWGTTEQLLTDLQLTWKFILLMCCAAFILSFILVSVLHYLTNIISWLICILVSVTSIALVAALWWTYYGLRRGETIDTSYHYLEQLLQNETAIYILAICATIFIIFLFMIMYFLRTQFSGLSALFEEAGDCMLNLPGLFLPFVLTILSLLVYLVFWAAVVTCLLTASYPGENSLLPFAHLTVHNETATATFHKNSTDLDYRTVKMVTFLEATWLKRMVIFYVIALIWITEFIFACQQMTIAGAVAFWYFRKPFDSPVMQSMNKLVKYHLGSVAKGSFLITLFKIPRILLTYLYMKLKSANEAGSEVASCCLKCCACWFWMLEKFIRYLNHNAYTVIAIESINFCPAAGVAWNAMMSNALQVATINSVGDFVLFLAKLLVSIICTLISIFVLGRWEDVKFYAAPVIVIALVTFFIAHVILSLYEIIVDTLFLCVCEDRNINGNNGRWRQSKLAHLLGQEQVEVEERIQAIEMQPIAKEPFSEHT